MQNAVIAEIAKHLGVTPQDIDPTALLAEDLGLGPVEMADLLGALSQKFDVTFQGFDVESLKVVNDIIEAIEDLSLE